MILNKEQIWKAVPDYEGLYEVSSEGNVRSLNRFVNGRNGKKLKKGKDCKPFKRKYLSVTLSKEGKTRQYSIHRLVALAFLDKPASLDEINHIDGIKDNNNVTNLEWCNRSQNLKHAIANGLFKPPQPTKGKFGKEHNRSIEVIQFDLNGAIINTFGSANEAARITGFIQTGISKCCRGELKTHKGFVWKYQQDTMPV